MAKKWDAIRASYNLSHDAFRVKIGRYNAKNGTSFTYKAGGDCSEQEYELFVKCFGNPNTPEHARTEFEQPEQSRTQAEQVVRESEQNILRVQNMFEQTRTDLNKSEQLVRDVRTSLNRAEQSRTDAEHARTQAEQVVRDLRNELKFKDLQIKNALDKSVLPEDLKSELMLLRGGSSELRSENVRIETELKFQIAKNKELQTDLQAAKSGAGQTESAKSELATRLGATEKALQDANLKIVALEKTNTDTSERLEIAERLNRLFEGEKSTLADFVKLLTDKYKGLFVAIGYLSVMSMFIVGKYEYTTFGAIFEYLKIPFASLFAFAMILFFQGRFVDDIGLTCFNIWLYGPKAKTQSEKILNAISIGFGVSIVVLMLLTAQRIWNTPQPKPEFDPLQVGKIQRQYVLDSTKCAFQFSKDSAKIVDSIGFETERRNVLKSKSWCNTGCGKVYTDSNTVALKSKGAKLSQIDCGLDLRNLESKRGLDLSNLKPVAQIDNRIFGLFVYLLFVGIRVVEILVKAIRIKENVVIAPKRLRTILRDFWIGLKNRI